MDKFLDVKDVVLLVAQMMVAQIKDFKAMAEDVLSAVVI
jgi:hypothetical protein